MGYLQSKLTYDLYVDVLVCPTRIPPRQSGAARPVVPFRGVQGKARSPVTYCSQQRRRAESLADRLQGYQLSDTG